MIMDDDDDEEFKDYWAIIGAVGLSISLMASLATIIAWLVQSRKVKINAAFLIIAIVDFLSAIIWLTDYLTIESKSDELCSAFSGMKQFLVTSQMVWIVYLAILKYVIFSRTNARWHTLSKTLNNIYIGFHVLAWSLGFVAALIAGLASDAEVTELGCWISEESDVGLSLRIILLLVPFVLLVILQITMSLATYIKFSNLGSAQSQSRLSRLILSSNVHLIFYFVLWIWFCIDIFVDFFLQEESDVVAILAIGFTTLFGLPNFFAFLLLFRHKFKNLSFTSKASSMVKSGRGSGSVEINITPDNSEAESSTDEDAVAGKVESQM
eukprot:CAMPEP_0168534246 /NCGR_PEP_ID=MMETSP0405-20121227/17743_1 /TAXON_ID=498012 /ORGANISM="Trichosphaerium sp, Strain Am-I-7 wt" /LENGTH=323 /DNA_ID=CAMNT_0008560831 /DNA_START=216 /DNA_END=1187 /DNA_ORIENTATION=-